MRANIILFSLFAFFLNKESIAQVSYDPLRSRAIRDIDNTVSIMGMNIKSFSKIEKENDSLGSVYDFFKGKELQLVSLKAYDSGLEKHVVWYYSNDEFIYAETTWVDPVTNKLVDHYKCYSNNGQLIAWIKMDNSSVDPGSPEFKSFSTQLAAYTTRLKEASIK